MARSYIKNSEIFLQPGWTDVKEGRGGRAVSKDVGWCWGELCLGIRGGVGLSVKKLGGVGVNCV